MLYILEENETLQQNSKTPYSLYKTRRQEKLVHFFIVETVRKYMVKMMMMMMMYDDDHLNPATWYFL
jgi:hypothetical protein